MVQLNNDLIQRILTSSSFVNFMSTYNLVITVILAIITISIMALLFVNIAKLSASSDNEYGRRLARSGILTCLICFAFIGSIDTVYAILMSIIFGM